MIQPLLQFHGLRSRESARRKSTSEFLMTTPELAHPAQSRKESISVSINPSIYLSLFARGAYLFSFNIIRHRCRWLCENILSYTHLYQMRYHSASVRHATGRRSRVFAATSFNTGLTTVLLWRQHPVRSGVLDCPFDEHLPLFALQVEVA
jgi:hypothetical protein